MLDRYTGERMVYKNLPNWYQTVILVVLVVIRILILGGCRKMRTFIYSSQVFKI